MSETPERRNAPTEEPDGDADESEATREPGTVREPIAAREDGEEMPRHDVTDREGMNARNETMQDGDTTPQEDVMARERAAGRKGATPSSGPRGASDIWPDTTDLRHRFDELQSEFIDDPKGAVTKAESLINDVVERVTRSLHERMNAMHQGIEETNDTEQLRQAMRGYRELVVWMESRRAA